MNTQLGQYSRHCGFTEVDGKNVQISIGEVIELRDFISVESEAGCSKVALIHTMKQISEERKKVVVATHMNCMIAVGPNIKKIEVKII